MTSEPSEVPEGVGRTFVAAPVTDAAGADACAALARAIDAFVLARMVGEAPRYCRIEVAAGLKHCGPGDHFSIWQWWRNTERLRVAADAWENLQALRLAADTAKSP